MLLIQFTGLSGAGKTSIAQYLKLVLDNQHLTLEVIDGDHYRKTVSKDLGFSKEDRFENIRRMGKAASHVINTDIIIISAINPYEEVRKELRDKYKAKTVWIDCDLNVLIKRDTKGLYSKSMLPDSHPEKLHNLTGVNDIYETPYNADFKVNTDNESLEESAGKILEFIRGNLS